MCGIVGIIRFKGKGSEQEIKGMCDLLYRRGPDAEGFFVKGNLALGHRRLSIIDLESGDQPMFSDDGNIVLVYNGEIYNFLELKSELEIASFTFSTQSDTEVLLKGYEAYGLDGLLERIEGMYAFALYDQNKDELYLVRDRFGEKPLYYFQNKNLFAFASELKAFEDKIEVKKIDLVGLNFFLSLTYIPAPYTIYKNVYKLEPGTYLTIKNGVKISSKKYYDLRERLKNQPKYDNFDQAKNALSQLLKRSVKQRMIADVPVGSFLSGGIDSSIITRIMAELSEQPINTFSIGFKEKVYDESERAQIIVDQVKANHHLQVIDSKDLLKVVDEVIDYYDEPYGDSSAISAFYLAELTREKVKVVLTGDCADELFGGYEKYLASYYTKKYKSLPKVFQKILKKVVYAIPFNSFTNVLQRKSKKVIDNAELSDFDLHYNLMCLGFQDKERKALLLDLYYEDIKSQVRQVYYSYDTEQELERSFFTDLNILLDGDMLVKVDRICMRHSIESRVPFLDSKLVEAAFLMPSDFKIKGREKKYILKETFKNILDLRTINFRKKGFGSPIDLWFKNELQDELKSVLNEDFIKEQQLFNYEVIKELIEEHLGGKKNHKSKLWNLYVFQKWYKKRMNET